MLLKLFFFQLLHSLNSPTLNLEANGYKGMNLKPWGWGGVGISFFKGGIFLFKKKRLSDSSIVKK